MSADNLVYISTVGNGTIDYANISNFQSLSEVGTLVVQITNTSPLPSQFSLSVNCSEYIQQVNSQYLSLNSMQSSTIQTSIQSTQQSSTNINMCKLVLFNSKGQFCQSTSLNFTTYQLQTTNPQLQNNTNPNSKP